MGSLQLHVESRSGASDRYVAQLTQTLAETLRDSEVDSVDRPRADGHEGTKGDVVAWADLIVTFTSGLPALLGMIRDWRNRSRDAKVTIELGGDKLVLEGTSREDERRLIDAFLAKHADTD